MANRNFPNGGKLYSMHVMPVQLGCAITIGASGAVSSFTGKGIQAVTKLATGVYQIQLQDNYYSLLHVASRIISPTTGSPIAAASLAAGTMYQITVVGTTNWAAVGLPSNLTPAVGMTFVASGAGTGTGTANVVGTSGITAIESASLSAMISANPASNAGGGYVIIQTLAATDASTTTLIKAHPASGSVIGLQILLNNSSVQ